MTMHYDFLEQYGPFRDARPLVFDVAARYWEVDLDLLALLEEVAEKSRLRPVNAKMASTVERSNE